MTREQEIHEVLDSLNEKYTKLASDAEKEGSRGAMASIAATIGSSMIPVIGGGLAAVVGMVGAGYSAKKLKEKLDGQHIANAINEIRNEATGLRNREETQDLMDRIHSINLDPHDKEKALNAISAMIASSR